MDLHVALITHKMSLFLLVHSFLPTSFVCFLQTSPSTQASSKCMPSKPSNLLHENELFCHISLMLLLASISPIYSTHGLVTRTVYCFTRALSIFQNHLHCVWTSCENTIMHRLSDSMASSKPLNWSLRITGFLILMPSLKTTSTPAIRASKERLHDIPVIVNWLHFLSPMLPERFYHAISLRTYLFQMARIQSSCLLIEWPRWPTSYPVLKPLQLPNLLNCLFLPLSDFTIFLIRSHQIVVPFLHRIYGLHSLPSSKSTSRNPPPFVLKRTVKQNV